MATTKDNGSMSIAQLGKDGIREKQYSDSLMARAIRRIKRDRLTLVALSVIAFMAILSFFAPFITENILHMNPEATDPLNRLLPPLSEGHFLGTDDLGRDYFARILHGGRISLAIGFAGAFITLGIGMSFGMIAGYFGGQIDDIMNWVITTLDSIPTLYLLILISTILRPSAEALVLVLALTGWTGSTRLMRGQTIQIRNLDYIMSARALGAKPMRIIYMHIMPNLLSLTMIALARGIGNLILVESTLSFLKLGVQPPTPTWGNMLSNAQQFFSRGPHLSIISGTLIFITVLCLYIIGDGLRDAFDPTLTD